MISEELKNSNVRFLGFFNVLIELQSAILGAELAAVANEL